MRFELGEVSARELERAAPRLKMCIYLHHEFLLSLAPDLRNIARHIPEQLTLGQLLGLRWAMRAEDKGTTKYPCE